MEEQLKEDTIKYTKEYSANNDILIETSTPNKIVADVKTYDIKNVRAEIAKIDNVIAIWEEKKKKLTDILCLYNTNKPKDNPQTEEELYNTNKEEEL